ncbi:DUF4440 domain-containing protein [Roseovarius sp.]|uniref:DUF4440 domain-containing protein n=1 Tax=Roseovarius sp. TaxID=1486281 RepID=UPI003BA8BBA8
MSGQDKSDGPDLQEILALEEAVWQALVSGDAAADAALLAPDFLGVYPSGFAGREEHAGQLADGPSVASYALSEARLVPAGAGHVLLCYRADYRWARDGAASAMYVSSLWRRDANGWRNLFSQDTPADAAPVP